MDPWAECYLQHFEKHLRKPFDVRLYRGQGDLSLRLATYDQASPGWKFLASVGLTEHAPSLKRVAEVVLAVDQDEADASAIFLNALFFLISKRIDLSMPFVIGGVSALRPGFAQRHDKAALYFAEADGFPDGFETVEGWEEDGEVLQAYFISAAEQDFVNRQGTKAFHEKFDLLWEASDPRRLDRPTCLDLQPE